MGAFSLNVAEFWEEFSRREWHPRPGGRDEDTLVGPFRTYGECLAPVSRPDELHWYSPRTPAQDGDIVLVQWDPDVLVDMYERNNADDEWLRQYGPPCPIATKVYKTVGTMQYLLTRKSALQLGKNRILGVLRKRLRDESCEAIASAGLIEPGAATTVESVEDDSVSLTNGGGVVLGDSLSATGFDHLLQITASFDVWITDTGGGTPEFYLAAINSGGTIQQSQSVFPTASASPGQRVTLQVEVPITTADEATTIFAQLNWTGAQPTGTAEVRNAAMRSEHIKR